MSSPEARTTIEQNKALMTRWFEEVWNQGRREAIHQLFAPECVLHDGSRQIRGPEEFCKFYDGLRSEFCEFKVTPDITLAQDDLVSLRWHVSCRHTPTEKPVEFHGISIARVKNGQFIEAWQNWDAAGVAAQIAS